MHRLRCGNNVSLIRMFIIELRSQATIFGSRAICRQPPRIWAELKKRALSVNSLPESRCATVHARAAQSAGRCTSRNRSAGHRFSKCPIAARGVSPSVKNP